MQDPAGGDPGVYLVPPDLLLEGPNGEYVFAADAMAAGKLADDLGRVVHAPIDAVYTVPVAALGRWAGTDELQVELDAPVAVEVGDRTQMVRTGAASPSPTCPRSSPTPAATAARSRRCRSRPSAPSSRPPPCGRRPSVPGSPGRAPPRRRDRRSPRCCGASPRGSAQVELFPAGTRVAEGQFAFVPDAEAIQAGITRRAPSYDADVTVQVLNGSGRVGVGEAVAERLASLDVNLPAPLNADSFSYRQTQILAGPDTLQVARDIRAILARGVVLDGPDLPDGTIQVIVGDDFEAP